MTMSRHFADDARIAPVLGQSRIGRVAVGEQRVHGCPPQRGQTKPPGQRRFDKKAAQLASSGNISRNCESDRPLAIVRPVADVSNEDLTMPLYHI